MKNPLLTLCACLLVVASALGLVYFLADAPAEQREGARLQGHVKPYHFIVTSDVAATVVKVHVEPGYAVHRGQLLAELDGSPVYAPVDGVIVHHLIHDGMPVGPKMHLFHIADPARVIVEAVAPRPEAGKFANGVRYVVQAGPRSGLATCDYLAAQCDTIIPCPPDLHAPHGMLARLVFVVDSPGEAGLLPGQPVTVVHSGEN